MNESTCSEDHKEELRQVMRTVHPGGSSYIEVFLGLKLNILLLHGSL